MSMKTWLIANCHEWHKFWSVRLAILGTALYGFVEAFPDIVLQAWNMLPPELKTVLPPGLVKYVPLVILLGSIVARLVKQKNVTPVVMILLCLFSPLAMAACPINSACLSVDPTPGWDTGDPIRADAVITYTFYRYDATKNTGIALGTKPQVFSNKAKILSQYDNEPTGKQCYMVDASVDSGNGLIRSPVSSTSAACKAIIPSNVKLLTPPNLTVQ